MDSLIPLTEVGKALNVKDTRTVEAACERHGIHITAISSHVRGLTAHDYATLICRARSTPSEPKPKPAAIAGVDILTAGEAVLIDQLRDLSPRLREHLRFQIPELYAPSGDRLPQNIADAIAAVLAEPSLTAQEAA